MFSLLIAKIIIPLLLLSSTLTVYSTKYVNLSITAPVTPSSTVPAPVITSQCCFVVQDDVSEVRAIYHQHFPRSGKSDGYHHLHHALCKLNFGEYNRIPRRPRSWLLQHFSLVVFTMTYPDSGLPFHLTNVLCHTVDC